MAHQAGDAVRANPAALGAQRRVHARAAINGSIVSMDTSNFVD